jgi:hypothetical protein
VVLEARGERAWKLERSFVCVDSSPARREGKDGFSSLLAVTFRSGAVPATRAFGANGLGFGRPLL